MKYVVDEKTKEAVPVRVIENLEAVKGLIHPLRQKILQLLSDKSMYPLLIAKELRIQEQKVYYHLRVLEKYGFVEKREGEPGAMKFYTTRHVGYCILPRFAKAKTKDAPLLAFRPLPKLLEGFVEDGRIACKVVVGAPFPHGELKRTSKSGYIAGEVTAVLGMYGRSEEKLVYTDIEIENFEENFIIISGLLVNTLQKKFNRYLPIKFDNTGNKIISTISGNEYTEPESGIICKIQNPFNRRKHVLVLAGIESLGTKACVFAFKKYLEIIG